MNNVFKTQTKSLKDALYDTIHHHPRLTVEAIAEELGMGRSYLYNSCKPDVDTEGETATGVRFPSKQIVPLCRLTGDYQVLDVMEWQLGRVAITMPEPNDKDPMDVQRDALRAVVEFGDFMKAVYESTEDGSIKRSEQERIDKEGVEAIRAMLTLMTAKV